MPLRTSHALAALALLACGAPLPGPPAPVPVLGPLAPPDDAPLAGEVDPFVGSANDGQTFPGALVPWGMASPSPHTTRRDPGTFIAMGPANAGYLHGEPTIFGFGQTHLSGVGCPDLGAPVVTPSVGEIDPTLEGNASPYDHETAHAGYYAVHLATPDVNVELSATARVGLHRLRFATRSDANVLIDVGRSLSWRMGEGEVRVVSSTEAEGSVGLGLFCSQPNHPHVYFVARFSRAARETGTWEGSRISSTAEAHGRAGAFFTFDADVDEPLVVAVGLSWTSTDAARAALDAEVPALDFDAAHAAAARAWQDELSRIALEGGEPALRRRVITALYHALIHPSLASDVNGDFRRADGTTGHDPVHERYTVFSLWDTYRTLHPLLSLAWPERQRAMVRTLAALAAERGSPPGWELMADEVQMMVGDPADVVLDLAVAEGLVDPDVDVGALYAALLDGAHDPAHRPGLAHYDALGYVPMQDASVLWAPVSTTLEDALADAALADLATRLGHPSDAAALSARAIGYRALYDASTGLLRPRNADGSWYEPFDPDAIDGSSFQSRSGGPGYVEGTAWAYQFFAPHDLDGLVALHGGADPFLARLRDLFAEDRFTMWNEPDVGFPYVFLAAGARADADAAIAAARERWFLDGPAGLAGNDDAGTLSAWLVWSAIGLYPDVPRARYFVGTPAFERVTITPRGGMPIVVAAPDAGRPYVTEVTWEGAPLTEPTVDHATLAAGGALTLRTSATPP